MGTLLTGKQVTPALYSKQGIFVIFLEGKIFLGFPGGGDGVWVCNLFYTGFQNDLRSFYILSILLLVREVTTTGVGWESPT
jgi:hypothetical protein